MRLKQVFSNDFDLLQYRLHVWLPVRIAGGVAIFYGLQILLAMTDPRFKQGIPFPLVGIAHHYAFVVGSFIVIGGFYTCLSTTTLTLNRREGTVSSVLSIIGFRRIYLLDQLSRFDSVDLFREFYTFEPDRTLDFRVFLRGPDGAEYRLSTFKTGSEARQFALEVSGWLRLPLVDQIAN